MNKQIKGLKTWSALAKNRRRPSEYEIVSTSLHYRTRYPDRAYELSPAPDLFMNDWYKRHVSDSPLQHPDWDSFRDPDQVIYRYYTRMQDGQEEYVDGLLDEYNEIGHDKELTQEWVQHLAQCYTPARYLLSTINMGSAYLVQMAPASTITNCAAFQEADAFRWLQRLAYRTRELQVHVPTSGIGEKEKEFWETDPTWQGYRELMEKVLCAYDWAEHLVALNVVAKPAIDEGVFRQLGVSARRHGDTLLALLIDNQLRDSERHKRWTSDLISLAREHGNNQTVMTNWVEKWKPLADKAIDAYCASLPDNEDAAKAAKAAIAAFHRSLQLA